MYAVLQRHAVLSNLVDDVDSMDLGGTVGNARSRFVDAFVSLDAFYANLSVEFIDVIVAFMIFGRGVEDCIGARVDRRFVVLRLFVFWCYKRWNDVLVVGFVFDWSDVELAVDQAERSDTIFRGAERVLEPDFPHTEHR